MNSYQIVFLFFILLPPIVSIAIDKLSYRVKVAIWIGLSDIVVALYTLEIIIVALMYIYFMLGNI
jgi:hypothetical protein|nr:MAG TPA: hypothetical protein [Caudoviricetes sp.]